MDGVQPKTIISASAEQLRALIDLLRRVPLTPLEALAVEGMFGGWFKEIEDQLNQLRALDRIGELSKNGAAGAGGAGDVLTGFGEAAGVATGDDNNEAAPDGLGAAVTNGTASGLGG